MPRPKSKKELNQASGETYSRLNELIDSIATKQLESEFPFEHRDRNVRDVLGHLLEWQLMMFRWYQTGMDGGEPEMPAPGHTWKSTPKLNDEIWLKYQDISLKSVQSSLARSHKDLMEIVDSHSNKELFTKQLYKWTGTTSLGSYLTSALSSHYEWAIKLIRRFVRSVKS